MDPERLAFAALAYPVLLLSLCFHEWGHAYSAKRLGDRTAESMGRLTMNPIAHMDPIGTVLFPLIMMLTPFQYLFGWAKPVPVNPLNLRKNTDMIWVALAGPACNLVLVIVTVLVFKAYLLFAPPQAELSRGEDVVISCFRFMILINLVLMWFNLIPVTPLDGSKVLLYNIPGHSRSMPFWQAYEHYGMYILLLLLFSGALWHILRWPMWISMRAIEFLL